MWFHRPFRADQWLLYAQETTSASGARGLARGEVFTEAGDLVVSVVQEGLIRTSAASPAANAPRGLACAPGSQSVHDTEIAGQKCVALP